MRTVNIGGEIRTALNNLGTSTEEIAMTLANKGIKAYCAVPSKCALAEYLRQQFPTYHFWITNEVVVWAPELSLDVQSEVDLTPVEEDFIYAFDNHKYPELEVLATV